jgi:hypothetical protein
MSPRGAPTIPSAIRLQTVQNLRVKRPNTKEANPCLGAMTAMLSCWASSNSVGGIRDGCAALEETLRQCADKGEKQKLKKSDINFHLGRLWPRIKGPTRRKGSLG